MTLNSLKEDPIYGIRKEKEYIIRIYIYTFWKNLINFLEFSFLSREIKEFS